MPNIGRPSQACMACRRRKVKCSESPPKCDACTRLGLSCEWKVNLTFRRQNDWAEKSVTRRVKQAQLLRGDTSFRGSAATSSLYPFLNQVISDMESCALQKFYREYAYTSGTFPFMYLVAPLFEETSTPACFYSAVRAVSLATTAKQLRRYEMMTRAREYYSQALRHLKTALGQPDVARHDGVLLALCLLCLYELHIFLYRCIFVARSHPICAEILQTATSAESEEHKRLSRIHSKGRLAVVRFRGPQQLHTKTGRNLFVLFYHQQLIWSFGNCGAILEEFPEWVKDWYPDTPVARLELAMHTVSGLASDIRKAVSKRQTALVEDMIERGKKLEESLATAVHDLLYSWPDYEDVLGRITGRDRLMDLPARLEFDFEDLPNNMDIYVNIIRALMANSFRATRIHLLLALNHAVTYLISKGNRDSDLNALPNRFSQVLQKVAEAISNDVPTAIDGYAGQQHDHCDSNIPNNCHNDSKPQVYGRAIRAWSMKFPLQSALIIPSIPEGIRKRLEGILQYTKEIVGTDLDGNY